MTAPTSSPRSRQLEAIYGEAYGPAVVKEIDHVNADYRAFIEAAPFCAIATSGPGGLDCTPRGDPPGFVRVLDEKTLLIPDRRGNNRIDSLRNLVADPRIALLFLIPGCGETIRVNGRAVISTDPALCESFVFAGKTPRTVIIVTVERVYFQCSKAIVRSKLWDAVNAHRPRDTADVRHHPRPYQQGCDRRPRARPRRARTHQGDDLLTRRPVKPDDDNNKDRRGGEVTRCETMVGSSDAPACWLSS